MKPGRFLALIGVLLLSVTCMAQSVMTHHVRDAVRNGKAQANGRLPNNQVLQLDLVLPLRDPAGLEAFLADVYNPKSLNYQQFLTPQQFTARFGATQDQYDTVVRFAKTYGLEVIGGSVDSRDVQVKGTVANIEAAFHVNMQTFRHPTEDRTFYSPDREPTLDLPFSLWHISGLDNYSIPRPLHISRDEYAQAHGIDAQKVASHATTGSGPSASFLGSDMRAAYYGTGSLTGAGQHVGLFEFLGTNLADLSTYYTNVHQTNNVPVNLISVDGSSTSCTYPRCDDTEQTLDMTQALGMAPGLASLDMYISTTSDVAIISAMTTHNPLPTAIGCSWGWSPVDPSTLDPYFQQMAAQGQNFFAASGDYSTWTKTGNSAAWPADDAYVVSVGGTDLSTASAAGPWASETAWADSGGGISPDGIAIPSWQQLSGVINSTNKGSTTLRNGPDVSANANFTFYTCANRQACLANTYGGTSFAAPMWAGFVALANQQYAQSNPGKTIGFINPNIYTENISGGSLTSAYAANFHDVTSGTSGSYSAATGFDLVTGWGSPQAALVNALSGPPPAGFTISASPSAVTLNAGSNGSTTISSSATGGFTGSVTLAASGQPSGVTIGFTTNPVSAGNSTSMTIAVGSGAAPGTYPITVTGKSGSTTETTTVTLTIPGATPSFAISANPTSLTITRGSSGSTTLTTTVSGGFSSSISLSASGQGSRVTVGFSPSSISGAGTSKMTVTVNRRASTGTQTIVVTATGGGVTHTVSIPITIQ